MAQNATPQTDLSKLPAVQANVLKVPNQIPANQFAAPQETGSDFVTEDMLLHPEKQPGNWLQVAGDYGSTRYSTLDQINQGNISGLHLAFSTVLNPISSGGRYATAQNEGTPLAEDGFLYIQSGWSVISKVDVRDGRRGKVIWRYDPQVDHAYVSDTACCGAENRGIGLWHDQVIALTMDGRMLSLNKETGKVTWEKQLTDRDRAETFTVAPQIVNDVAIVGPAGGELGIRGYIEAVNLADGSVKWKTYTVPGPGEAGHDTWPGRTWETGGASVWQTGSYDPDLNLIYWGTGNPAPMYDAEYRPGDNLYSDSMLALDADTGKIKWYFQYTPNDPYDHDEIGDSQIVNAVINGEPRKEIIHVGRNGFVYGFDRADGEFLWGKQYVNYLNWTQGLDPKTGRPVSYDPSKTLQSYVQGTAARRGGPAALQCPGLTGGKNWQPASFDPKNNLIFTGATEGCDNTRTAKEAPNPTVTGGTWKLTDPAHWSAAGNATPDQRPPLPQGYQLQYSVSAIDPTTGAVVAKHLLDAQAQGMLSTAGNLVFAGDHAGNLTAYDPKTMNVVWQWNVGTALYGPPMTYTANGKQYIAILSGGDSGLRDNSTDPSVKFFVPVDALYVFAL